MIVFLSTGRCGTQWLADCLARAYAGRLVARHEPLGPHYAPRLYFRRYDELEAMARRPPIAAHLAELESRGHPYVETGWPVYAALPSMAQRFPERLRIVHLTRHLV